MIRVVWIASGVLASVAALAMLVRGDLAGLAAAVLFGLALYAIGRRAQMMREIAPLLALVYTSHAFGVVAVQVGSAAVGHGGFVVGDDQNYFDVASRLAAMWHGAPYPTLPNDAYLIMTYVYIEAAVFYLIGPHVTVLEMMNAALATGMVVATYALGRSLFERRAGLFAAIIVGFYPSLFGWTVLNLKDAMALVAVMTVLLAMTAFVRSPRWWLLAITLILLGVVASVRQYVYIELALITVIAAALATTASWMRRTGWVALSIAGVALVLFVQPPTLLLNNLGRSTSLLADLEQVRFSMGLNARTGFQSDLPTQVGETYIVPSAPPPQTATEATAAPGSAASSGTPPPSSRSSAPTPAPTTVHVEPGTRIVVITAPQRSTPPAGAVVVTPSASSLLSSAAAATPTASSPSSSAAVATASAAPFPSESGVVYVRPGDVVVVGGAQTTPAPEGQRHTLNVPVAGAVQVAEADPHTEVPRTLSYLPRGLAYALFAPFPWSATHSQDLLTIPEMGLWYLIFALAAVAVLRRLPQWRFLALVFLYAGMTAGVLALTEGNVGTLFRHRAMYIPPVILLAAPAIVAAVDLVYGKLRRTRAA